MESPAAEKFHTLQEGGFRLVRTGYLRRFVDSNSWSGSGGKDHEAWQVFVRHVFGALERVRRSDERSPCHSQKSDTKDQYDDFRDNICVHRLGF